jgi:photosystem II stability/assembly factor-like uncharacterized protein
LFIDRLHGWVVADDGSAAATPDGGKHWVTQKTGSSNGFSDIGMTDACKGWVVGDNGTIMRTTTAGYGDFFRPSTRAYAAGVLHGRIATLRYRVTDSGPSCGYATVTLKIKTKAGKTVKTLRPGVKPMGATKLKATFRCRLKTGTYRIWVYATDAAGHPQKTITKATLTVR